MSVRDRLLHVLAVVATVAAFVDIDGVALEVAEIER